MKTKRMPASVAASAQARKSAGRCMLSDWNQVHDAAHILHLIGCRQFAVHIVVGDDQPQVIEGHFE